MTFRDACRELACAVRDLCFPRGCAACDMPDEVLCARCRGLLADPQFFALPDSVLGWGMACGRYGGALRRAILGWKDHGDVECDIPFAEALGQAVDALVRSGCLERDRAYTVVPVPSSPRSVRRRGRRQCVPLAIAVADRLADYGVAAEALDLLRIRGIRLKSVQVTTAAQRRHRVAGHVQVDEEALRSLKGNVILIDDIVTSGATMRTCTALLDAHGASVWTAMALVHTPPRGAVHQGHCDTFTADVSSAA